MKKKLCAILGLAIITLSSAFAPMQVKAGYGDSEHFPELYKTEFLDATTVSCTTHKNCNVIHRRYRYYYICTDCDYSWSEVKTYKTHQSK